MVTPLVLSSILKNNHNQNNNNSLIADSGCTHILFPQTHAHLISPNHTITPLQAPIIQPDGSTLHATTSGITTIAPSLSVPAHIVPGLKHALGGIAPIVDTGCTVTFDATHVTVFRDNKIIAMGDRQGNLWHLPVQLPPTKPTYGLPPGLHSSPSAHQLTSVTDNQPAASFNAYPMPQGNKGLMQFYQRCLGNPTKSTLVQAAVKGLLPWPTLTPHFIRKWYVPSLATSQGHLHRMKAGVQSTHATIIPDSETTTPSPPTNPNILTINLSTFNMHNALHTDAQANIDKTHAVLIATIPRFHFIHIIALPKNPTNAH